MKALGVLLVAATVLVSAPTGWGGTSRFEWGVGPYPDDGPG